MENQIEEVKTRIDIVDYIGSIVQLKKAGRNFKSICPFHQEKSPSFVVSPERQTWHCFGACHEGGDIYSFVMKWENITFYEALKELAEKAGIALKTDGVEDKEWNKKERLLQINTLTARYFEYILHSTSYGKTGLDYLINRSIPIPIIKKFQIGYAPRSWDSLMNFLSKKGFTKEEMFEAGVLVKNDNGRFYDRFRGRVVFPICDMRGNVIGFSGRLIDQNSVEGKYINTPETPLYHKRESLYGIQVAKEAIRKAQNVFLVEGEFDMITPYIHGVENIVAIKGSAVTREQLHILKRFTNKITLALDADEAGEDAMKKGIEEAERQEFEIQVVSFTVGKDPDEAIHKDLVAFKKAIKYPEPVYDFIIGLGQKKYNDGSAFAKKNIGDFVIPFIARIQNPIIQSHYSKKLSTLLDVNEESIITLVKKAQKFHFQRKPFIVRKPTSQHTDREILLEKYLISTMLQNEKPYEMCDKIFAILNTRDFSIPAYEKLCDAFITFKTGHQVYDHVQFASSLPAELVPSYDELFMFSSADGEFTTQNLVRLIYELKKTSLKRKIKAALSSEVKENATEELEIGKLSQELKEVEKLIQTL